MIKRERRNLSRDTSASPLRFIEAAGPGSSGRVATIPFHRSSHKPTKVLTGGTGCRRSSAGGPKATPSNSSRQARLTALPSAANFRRPRRNSPGPHAAIADRDRSWPRSDTVMLSDGARAREERRRAPKRTRRELLDHFDTRRRSAFLDDSLAPEPGDRHVEPPAPELDSTHLEARQPRRKPRRQVAPTAGRIGNEPEEHLGEENRRRRRPRLRAVGFFIGKWQPRFAIEAGVDFRKT